MNHRGQLSVRWGDLEPPSPPHTGMRASSEDPAWQDNENRCCMASADQSSYGDITDTSSSSNRGSRYANMGLNRPHALAPYRPPEIRKRDTTEVDEPDKNYQMALDDEEEDLAELATLMVPAELRSLAQQREESSSYGWQPINKTKTSRYTEWQLTFGGASNPKGWQLVDSAATPSTPDEGTLMADIFTGREGITPDVEGMAIDPPATSLDTEDTREESEDADNSLWIDGKYFEHYGYLDYVKNADTSQNVDRFVASPRDKSKLKVPLKKGVQLGLDRFLLTPPTRKFLVSQRQPTNTSAKMLATKDKPTNAVYQPVRDAFEVHNEAKADTNAETSSNETGMWELLEGNVDAPRTGNVSPHKLIIKLRHIMTDERKTLTYTGVDLREVDWTSKQQIAAITKWRTNTFHEHGIKTKKNMLLYTPLEDAWMLLFHRKLRATIEAGHIIKLPGPANVMIPFNAYFEGRTLKDANGEDVGSRPARDAVSIRAKLDGRVSKIAMMRREMRVLITSDNGGPMFVPGITEEELERFLVDGTVAVEGPKEADRDTSSSSEGKKSKRSSPKRKREKGDGGERDGKKAREAMRVSPTTQE